MKSFIVNSCLLSVMLASVISCGSGGNTNATLQVSQSFIGTNPYFNGGLLIKGRNLTTGSMFFQSLDITTEFKTTLDKGRWIITAVGWDGGNGDKKFAGDPYCGILDKTLDTDSVVLDLTVKKEECQKFAFARGHVDNSPAIPTLKKLGLVNTCRSFLVGDLLPTDTISNKLIDMSTPENFCEPLPTSLRKDIRTEVQGMRIFAINKEITSLQHTIGYGSPCIKASTGSISKIEPANGTEVNPYTSGNDLRLPMDSAAFLIRTYKDNTCTKAIADYPFRDGLVNGAQEYDSKLVYRNSSEVRLFLPSSDVRRAYSVFEAILPTIAKYNGGSPELMPTEPPALNLVAQVMKGSNTVNIKGSTNCTISSPVNMTSPSCSPTSDGVQLQFNTTASTDDPASLDVGGTIYSFLPVDPVDFAVNQYKSHKIVIDALGYSGDSNVSRFFEIKDDDKKFGTLSKIREMLSGGGAGGVLGVPDPTKTFAEACETMVLDSLVRIQKFGESDEVYRVTINNYPTKTFPTRFTCNTLNPDESACTAANSYQKRMKIFDVNANPLIPEMVLEFNCNTQVGRMETVSMNKKHTPYSLENQIITWNTDPAANNNYQRFEKVSIWKELDAAYNLTGSESRQIQRVLKTGDNDFELLNFSFNTHKEGSLFSQMAEYSRVKYSSGYYYYKFDTINTSNSDPKFILNPAYDSSFYGLNAGPVTPTRKYDITQSYPQVTFTPSGSLLDFTGANFVDNTLPLSPASLTNSYFTTAFGQSFYLD